VPGVKIGMFAGKRISAAVDNLELIVTGAAPCTSGALASLLLRTCGRDRRRSSKRLGGATLLHGSSALADAGPVWIRKRWIGV